MNPTNLQTLSTHQQNIQQLLTTFSEHYENYKTFISQFEDQTKLSELISKPENSVEKSIEQTNTLLESMKNEMNLFSTLSEEFQKISTEMNLLNELHKEMNTENEKKKHQINQTSKPKGKKKSNVLFVVSYEGIHTEGEQTFNTYKLSNDKILFVKVLKGERDEDDDLKDFRTIHQFGSTGHYQLNILVEGTFKSDTTFNYWKDDMESWFWNREPKKVCDATWGTNLTYFQLQGVYLDYNDNGKMVRVPFIMPNLVHFKTVEAKYVVMRNYLYSDDPREYLAIQLK